MRSFDSAFKDFANVTETCMINVSQIIADGVDPKQQTFFLWYVTIL